MKKLSILFAAFAAMLGFTACDTDGKVELQIPEEGSFVLNEPAMGAQTLELVKGGTFQLVCSQPAYGTSVVTNYFAEVSLTEDFEEFEVLTPIDPNQARMTFNDNDLAIALCQLHGFTSQELYVEQPAGKIYFRAHAEVANAEGTGIYSNIVEMESVKFYYAANEPGQIYVVGNISGSWVRPSADNADFYKDWQLTETGIQTGIYQGSFEVPAAPMFRFYTALGEGDVAWDENSIGYQEEDNATDFEFDGDGYYTSACVNGKGSWNFPNFAGGTIRMVVDLNKMTVEFFATAAGEIDWDGLPCIWLVGDPNGWPTPNEDNAAALADWRLYDLEGNGIYVTKEPFTIEEGKQFRFYTKLDKSFAWDGWGDDGDENSVGPSANDTSVEIEAYPFVGTATYQKGNWKTTQAAVLNMEVDLNGAEFKVTFTPVEE